MRWDACDDEALVAKVRELRGDEICVTAEIVGGLAEMERRKIPVSLGYSSLFVYCVEELKYSKGSAHRRSRVAKLAIDLPEIVDYLRDGRVSLAAAYQLRDVMDADVLAQAVGKSEAEAEILSAELRGEPDDRIFALRLMVSHQFLVDLDKARDALGHVVPDRDKVDVLHECVVRTVAAAEDKRVGTGDRYVPVAVARQVRRRADYVCEFRGADGHRCGSRFQLELHHVEAHCRGGRSTVANLRLYCSSHNNFQAELDGLACPP